MAGGFIGRTVDTLLAATQSSFFESRLVVTAGLRGDRITFDQHGDTRLSTDEDEVLPLRYNNHKSGYTRVLLFEPRKFRLTVGVGS